MIIDPRPALAPIALAWTSVLALLALLTWPASGGTAPFVEVEVDHAKVLEIDAGAATVIVGNPSIVDVEVLSATRLVLTGKTYGITNIIVLDAAGQIIVDEQVAVQTFEDQTVRVYRQASRETLACAPKCEPTLTIGDDLPAFQNANAQYQARQAMANEAAKAP